MSQYTILDSVNDQYPHFSDLLKERFATFSDKPLFTTNAEGLFEAFLDNLPMEARQHYTCRCCKNFVERFGGLVYITEDGELVSVMWDEKEIPKFFAKSVKAMKRIVLNSRVTGVFVSSERVLGQPSSGGWSHMHVELPRSKVFGSRIRTAGQEMARLRDEYLTLVNGLIAYPLSAVDQAVSILESETLYRSDRVLGVAKFVQELHNKRFLAKNSKTRDNITWLAVVNAPAGFCHIKSSMIGTLLDDIVSGLSFDLIKRRFDEKMNPASYMRAQSAPSQGSIQQAEKIVQQLGIENSLQRRYATYEEIPQFIWQGKEPVQKKATAKSGGVFANITPKEKTVAPINALNLPTTVMTWDKFSRTVLPTAESVEVLVDNPNRLMALVTASDQDAPNILQWDNTFSWYYHGGIDGEIKRRVEQAGGQYENNEIRVSLIWEGYTDLDLHCITPDRKHIYYSSKRNGGGWLDVDANGIDGKTLTPVENLRFNNGNAREGHYRFYVHNYSQYRGSGSSTPFKAELEVNGKIYTFSGVLRDSESVDVFVFDYIKGQHPSISGAGHTSVDAWSVPVNGFVKVKGITESPNLWGEAKVPQAGQHIFFLLEGCKDTSEGKGRGFFVETLKSDLREIRKTLEAYTASTPIEDVEQASACGVGYSKDSEWGLTLKVTSNNSTRFIKIDRFD